MSAAASGRRGWIDERYKQPLWSAFLVSFSIEVFTGLILDAGRMQALCTFALIGYWAGILLILLRRPHSPTPGDLAYIRFGTSPGVRDESGPQRNAAAVPGNNP
jgi:hypothetical protein